MKKTMSPTACQNQNDAVRWAEAGWAEASWRSNVRFVYSWGTTDCMWRYYDDYSLTDGQFYSWRVRRVAGQLRTAILWNGDWAVLNDYSGPDCFNTSNTAAICAVEDYVEVFTKIDGNHPDWSGTIGNKELQLQQFNASWGSWDLADTASFDDASPYEYCIVSQFDHFTVEKGGTC